MNDNDCNDNPDVNIFYIQVIEDDGGSPVSFIRKENPPYGYDWVFNVTIPLPDGKCEHLMFNRFHHAEDYLDMTGNRKHYLLSVFDSLISCNGPGWKFIQVNNYAKEGESSSISFVCGYHPSEREELMELMDTDVYEFIPQ